MLAQRALEVRRDARQRVPEDGVHEIEARAHLVGHRGACRARPVGQPEGGDFGPERQRRGLTLARQEAGIAEAVQRLGDPLELRQHRPALGLGRVGGQHQLDAERSEQRRHLRGCHAPLGEKPHRLPDRLRARRRMPGSLAFAEGRDAVRLLGEVHQVEVDGKGRRGHPRAIVREPGHLGRQARAGRGVAAAAGLGEGSDPLFDLEERDRLLRPEHVAERLAEQVNGRREVHGPNLRSAGAPDDAQIGTGVMFQISSAYCWIARSLENLPMRATLRIDVRVQTRWSR